MKRLYRFDCEKTNIKCDISVNKIKLNNPFLLFAKEEKFSVKEFLIRLRWCFFSFGKAIVYYCYSEEFNSVIHTSYVIPKCCKFPFMQRGDFQIGPCMTDSKARGRGIYPKVLNFIVNDLNFEKREFYMIVNDNNPASVKGIKKAGFVETGFEIVHNSNGIYQAVKIQENNKGEL